MPHLPRAGPGNHSSADQDLGTVEYGPVRAFLSGRGDDEAMMIVIICGVDDRWLYIHGGGGVEWLWCQLL
ncbi:hypothetical protein QVD17_24107 [Tagetes erecta]|uniref:Uncharacterized protein n=1 Tax=Tagetes erecta TaxID=13708 RepID=A0AAD8KHS6_TARER|nr:hypothetical protein QVD17_24107 [Tagetes erecta]